MIVYPMLAETGTGNDLKRKDLLFEAKLDGVRCIAHLTPLGTRLQGRSGSDITKQFPELAELHQQVKRPCILDGELTCITFNAIQHRIHRQGRLDIKAGAVMYPVTYFVFDILYLDGSSVKALPLIQRKAILERVFSESLEAKLLAWHTASGENLFGEAKEKELEGIMGKAMNSPYLEGKRSDAWLKIKNFKEATYYICGLTEGENDRASTFGSVILGDVVDGELTYVGNVGSGFNQDQLVMLLKVLEFDRAGCPFARPVNVDRPVKFWTRPEWQVEVRYLELSPDGKLRFPTFRRLVAKERYDRSRKD